MPLGHRHTDTVNAEECWPDMEGFDSRDTVTEFNIPDATFFDCHGASADDRHAQTGFTNCILNGVLKFRGSQHCRDPRLTHRLSRECVDRSHARHRRFCRLSIVLPLGDDDPWPKSTLQDPGILRTAAQHNKLSVGIYATASAEARSAAVTQLGLNPEQAPKDKRSTDD